MFGEGISKEGELVDYGVKLNIIDKAGAWFSYNEGKLGQGKENVKSKFKEDTKLRDEIESKIKEALGITSMLTMDSQAIKDSE
jgi:recombination protein RecA